MDGLAMISRGRMKQRCREFEIGARDQASMWASTSALQFKAKFRREGRKQPRAAVRTKYPWPYQPSTCHFKPFTKSVVRFRTARLPILSVSSTSLTAQREVRGGVPHLPGLHTAFSFPSSATNLTATEP